MVCTNNLKFCVDSSQPKRLDIQLHEDSNSLMQSIPIPAANEINTRLNKDFVQKDFIIDANVATKTGEI